jgi:xanthine dehydrogenase YagS FAD-binding subunit
VRYSHRRAREVEDFLKGKVLSEQVAEAAADMAMKATNPLSKNKYKVQIARALIRRAVLFAREA